MEFSRHSVTPGHNEVAEENVNIRTEPASSMINMEEDKTVYLNEQQCSEVMKILKQQRLQGKFCDVLVTAQNKNIWCHSCVLAANFKWFHSYNGQTLILQADTMYPKSHIHIQCNDVKILEAVLDYAYTGYLAVSMDNAEELLILALKFECDDIIQCCSLHLEKNLDIASWYDVLKISLKYNMSDLKQKVMEYCIDNFSLIAQDDKILLVSPDIIFIIVSKSNIEGCKDREIYKLVVILRWTVHSYVDRAEHLASLLGSVCNKKVTKQDMEDVIGGILGYQPNHEVLKQKDMCDFINELSDEKFVKNTIVTQDEELISDVLESAKPVASPGYDNVLKNQNEINSDTEVLDTASINCETLEENSLKDKSIHESTSDAQIQGQDTGSDVRAEQIVSDDYKISQKEFAISLNLCTAGEKRNDQKIVPPTYLKGIISDTSHTRPGRKTRKPSKYAAYADVEMTAAKSSKESSKVVIASGNATKGKPDKNMCGRTKRRKRKTFSKGASKPELSDNIQSGENWEPKVTTGEPVSSKSRKRLTSGKVKRNAGDTTGTEHSSPGKEEDWFGPKLLPIQKRFRGKKAKTEEEMYACEKCPRKFTTPSKLHHHILAHGSDTPYLCETCGFSTKHYSSMNIHKKRHLGKDLKCTLPGCNFSTLIRSRFEDHIDAHKGVKNHMCSVCGKAFAGRKHMQRHEKIHNVKNPRNCTADGCDYSTGRTDKLKDHIMQHHTEIALDLGYGKSITCKVEGCEFKCVLQSQLKDHIKRYHLSMAVELGYVKPDSLHCRDIKTKPSLLQHHEKGFHIKRSIIESVTNFDPSLAGSPKLQLCFNPKGSGTSASNVLRLITARPVAEKRKSSLSPTKKKPSILDGLSVAIKPSLPISLHKQKTSPVALHQSNNEMGGQQIVEGVNDAATDEAPVSTSQIVLKTVTSEKNDVCRTEQGRQQTQETVQQQSNTWVLNIAPTSQY